MGTWNVKGFSDEKQFCLMQALRRYSIDILCLQETWVPKAEYYYEDGFWIILSSTADSRAKKPGVGFIVAPWALHMIHGFVQYSARVAYLKVTTGKGKMGLFTAYAPQNLRPHDERQDFYVELNKAY